MLGSENILWCIVALGGAWDGVGTSVITDRLKNEMVRALLGIDDGVAGGNRSIGKVRVCEIET
jgi:hypothetical protein